MRALHQEPGQRAVAFPLSMHLRQHQTYKQTLRTENVFLVNVKKQRDQIIFAQSRRNKIFRIFWKSVCTEQILLSRALPILPDWQWLEILGFCFPITSQDHLLAHQQTLWVKKKPRCNFRCSVHLLHFCDPLLTRVSKATCGQAGDSKSSENWSTRGCPKIQSFQVGSRIETKVCSSKYSSTADLQKLKIYWF